MKVSTASPRLALIGAGRVARRFHLPALRRIGWSPAVVVDRDAALAAATGQACGALALSEIAALPPAIEAALVSTPPATHPELVAALLARGIDVLVEKPMATSHDEAVRMQEAAAASSARLWIGNQRRQLAGWRWGKDLIASGALGTIRAFAFEDGNRMADNEIAPEFWWPARAEHGGVLLDLGPHTIDLMRWWLGDMRVDACRDDRAGGVDTDVRIECTSPSGAAGHVELSMIRRLSRTAMVAGDNGRLVMELYSGAITVSGNVVLPAPVPGGEPSADAFTRQLQTWRSALQGDARAAERLVDAEAGASTMAFIDRSRAIARSVQPDWHQVRLPDPAPMPPGPILVTGATGFIGGRLVEAMVERGADVRAVVRGLGGAARLARLGLVPSIADFGDSAAMTPLLHGTDTVFHTGFDPRAPADASVAAAAAFARAARLAGVRRFVHLSSTAIYQPFADADRELDETRVPAPDPGTYAMTKWRIEQAIVAEAKQGLRAIVLQPGIVHGPFGRLWTDRLVDAFASGDMVLPDGPDGWCNVVHVDDLVQAMLCAAAAPETAIGESFIVTAAAATGWHDHFASIAAIVDGGGIRTMPHAAIARLTRRRGRLAMLTSVLNRPAFQGLRGWIATTLGTAGVDRVKAINERRADPTRIELHDPAALRLYKQRIRQRSDKAQSLLGFTPLHDADSGRLADAAYIRWAFPAVTCSAPEDRRDGAPPAT